MTFKNLFRLGLKHILKRGIGFIYRVRLGQQPATQRISPTSPRFYEEADVTGTVLALYLSKKY
ncbi:MAG: hypothetical protein GJU76_07000 [Gallionella sp.]|nr:hypothetical protein [Gallionella sp.]